MRRRVSAVAAVASSLIIAVLILGAVPKQDIPEFPIVYGGNVVVQGQPVPEGVSVVACVGGCEGWESEPVLTLADGRYVGLILRAPSSLRNEEITFWIVEPESGARIQADETGLYVPDTNVSRTLDLSFAAPIPTPIPATATALPPPATATAIPPSPGDPAVQTLSRVVVFAGIGALLVGGTALFLVRRRRVF